MDKSHFEMMTEHMGSTVINFILDNYLHGLPSKDVAPTFRAMLYGMKAHRDHGCPRETVQYPAAEALACVPAIKFPPGQFGYWLHFKDLPETFLLYRHLTPQKWLPITGAYLYSVGSQSVGLVLVAIPEDEPFTGNEDSLIAMSLPRKHMHELTLADIAQHLGVSYTNRERLRSKYPTAWPDGAQMPTAETVHGIVAAICHHKFI